MKWKSVDSRLENVSSESSSAPDARREFIARAFALREENAKLVDGLFEVGVEMNRLAITPGMLARRQRELSWHAASESMKTYAACLQVFDPHRTKSSAENCAAKASPSALVEDHENLCFEEIAARLMETKDTRPTG